MIRRYKAEDFEYADLLQRSFYLFPATQDELRAKLENPSWVVDEDGVVGCLIICPENDKLLLWSVVVASGCRGRGFGSLLLDAADQFYSGQKLWLRVEPLSRARKFYQRRGYQEHQYLQDFYGTGYDAVEMYKIC